jgi:hypothetical protein
MSTSSFRVLGAAALLTTLAACVEPVPVYREPPPVMMRVPGPPPEAIVERLPPPPGPDYVWQQGHWRFENGQYVWRPGHYVLRPPHAGEWIPAHWVQREGAWYFVEGHWR